MQALGARAGEAGARSCAPVATLVNGWGKEARQWVAHMGHSGYDLPGWDCDKRPEHPTVAWAADTTPEATMQVAGMAALRVACASAKAAQETPATAPSASTGVAIAAA